MQLPWGHLTCSFRYQGTFEHSCHGLTLLGGHLRRCRGGGGVESGTWEKTQMETQAKWAQINAQLGEVSSANNLRVLFLLKFRP